MKLKLVFGTVAACLGLVASAAAQVTDLPDVGNLGRDESEFFRLLNSEDLEALRAAQSEASHASLDLGWRQHGLSFGNASVWHGVRFNWRDAALREIRGLNVTLWKPGPNVDGRIDALSLGLWGPRADEVNGVSLGLVMVRARAALRGLWFGGVLAKSRRLAGVGLSVGAQVARGPAVGVFVSGVGNVAALENATLLRREGAAFAPLPEGGWGPDQLHGLAVGGIANTHIGGVRGVQLAGIVNTNGGHLAGLQVGGLANLTRGDVRGIQVGIANVAVERTLGAQLGAVALSGPGSRGLMLGALGTWVDDDSTGLTLGGLGSAVQGDANGLVLGGLLATNKGHVRGLAVAGGLLHCEELTGLGVGGLVNLSRRARGLQFGLVNEVAEELRGITVGGFNRVLGAENGYLIGLLNYVPENPTWLRWLPVFNTSF